MKEAFTDIQASMIRGNTDEYKAELKSIIENELKDLIDEYGFEIEVSSGSFNSINPGRIDGQTIYHTY
jgi:threonine synthase